MVDTGTAPRDVTACTKDGTHFKIREGIYIPWSDWNALNPHERYIAETLAYGLVAPKALFSHQTAAYLQGLWVVRKAPAKIHVYCPNTSRGSSRLLTKHPRDFDDSMFESTEWGLTATVPARTVLDCALNMPYRSAVALADSALFLRRVGQNELIETLGTYNGRRAVKAHRVAQGISVKSESPGESYVRLLLDDMGIRYIEQYEIAVGGRVLRVDFYLPDYGVVVEFDGKSKYFGVQATAEVLYAEREREKELRNLNLGAYRTTWGAAVLNPNIFVAGLTHYLKTRKVH